jgi:hypothetical protein
MNEMWVAVTIKRRRKKKKGNRDMRNLEDLQDGGGQEDEEGDR